MKIRSTPCKIGKESYLPPKFGRLNRILRATQIKTYSWDSAQVMLVANKADMESERVVSTQRGEELANQLGSDLLNLLKRPNHS